MKNHAEVSKLEMALEKCLVSNYFNLVHAEFYLKLFSGKETKKELTSTSMVARTFI